MRRVLLPFEFYEPSTVQEAVGLVNGDKVKFLAGGVDLVLKMRRREVLPVKVIRKRFPWNSSVPAINSQPA